MPGVVGVEDRHEVAGGGGEPARGRGRQTGVGLTDDADAVAVAGEQLGGPVGRAVIHHEDLQPAGGIALGERAVDRLAQIALVVVRTDEDRDRRVHADAFAHTTGLASRYSPQA
jgi:hypothetical protein